jgi:hypothetical protein
LFLGGLQRNYCNGFTASLLRILFGTPHYGFPFPHGRITRPPN